MSPSRHRSHWTASAIAAVLAITACGDDPAPDAPPDDFGMGSVAIEVQRGTDVSRWCTLLADTNDERARGLMQRRDLGPYDGMLFIFDEDTSARFHMTNTPLPLSIAWFARDGSFISAADMAPCLDQAECPRYSAARAYRYALEVPQGALDERGIGEGSTLSVGGSCDRP